MAVGNRENLAWEHGNEMVMGIDSGNSTKVQGIPVRTNPNQNDTTTKLQLLIRSTCL